MDEPRGNNVPSFSQLMLGVFLELIYYTPSIRVIVVVFC